MGTLKMADKNEEKRYKRRREGITFSFLVRKGTQNKRTKVSPKKNILISVTNSNHERNNPKEN